MAKQRMFLIGCFLMLTFSVTAQTEPLKEIQKSAEVASVNEIKALPMLLDADAITLKRIERISADPRVQNKSINYGKSQEIISIKAYIRILHMKQKETQMS